ncbi:MAG: TonB-dependent receptor [Phenylobacterium sp.]
MLAIVSAGAAAAQSADTRVDEVVVTAQRRVQAAQDVGIALSVVAGDTLEEKNISVVNDLETAIPNLEVDSQFGGGQPQFRIRGIGAREYSSNNASTVGVYIDEVAHPYTVTTQGALFDVQRIEVLRGPQGTLYGRNTTGGAVNIITNAPSAERSGGLTAEYGSYDRWRLEAFVSGPLSPTVRARLAATTEQGGAWQYNRDTREHLGDADRMAVRGRLTWDISEKATLNLAATYQRDQSDGLGFRLLSPYAAVGGPTYPADTEWRITGWRISPALAAIAGVDTNAKPFRDNEGLDASARLDLDLGFATLTSLTARQSFDRREYNDWDSTRFYESDVYFYNDIDVFEQEFRLTSNGEGPANWLLGAHYADESNDGGFYTQFRSVANIINTAYQQDVKSFGAFTNGSYQVTDAFSIVGGLRYEDESRELKSRGTTQQGLPQPALQSYETGMKKWSGKVGVEYIIAPSVLGYANIARGVKSGGFTTYNATSATPFRPERVVAYEAGVKSEFLDRRLRLNGAAFYYDYRDQQVQGLEYDTITGRLGKITNAPKSHIYGVEFEAAVVAFRGFEITQFGGYKKGEYDEYFAIDGTATDAANPVNGPWTRIIANDLSGQRLGFPTWTYGGAVSYDWTVGSWGLRAETNYNYRSSLYSVTTTTVIPKYWVFNANLSAGPTDGDWRVGVWARNLFNEYYEETRNGFNSSSRRTTSPHQPRTVGVRLSVSL